MHVGGEREAPCIRPGIAGYYPLSKDIAVGKLLKYDPSLTHVVALVTLDRL